MVHRHLKGLYQRSDRVTSPNARTAGETATLPNADARPTLQCCKGTGIDLRPTQHADPLREDLHIVLGLRCQHDRLEVGVQR